MRFRSLLLKLAKESPHPRFRHAAIVARGKRIIGRGVNHDSRHAEAEALSAALISDQVAGSTLYTLCLRRTGSVGNGSPCEDCMEMLSSWGVRRVVVYL